jgi:hypothetical protein
MATRRRSTTNEVRLTQAFVSTMRYLPSELWFSDLLAALAKKNPKAGKLLGKVSPPQVLLWPSHPIPRKSRQAFGRLLSVEGTGSGSTPSIIPDAEIVTKDWRMAILCDFSSDPPAERIFQQHAASYIRSDGQKIMVLLINAESIPPPRCARRFKSRFDKSVRVDVGDSLARYVAARTSDVLQKKLDDGEVEERLLWISWQAIARLFQALDIQKGGLGAAPGSVIGAMGRIRSDLTGLIARAGYTPTDYDILSALSGLEIDPAQLPEPGVFR